MNPGSDDDVDDPPAFPMLLWIPAICWIGHGAASMLLSLTATVASLAFAGSPFDLICTAPFFGAIGAFLTHSGLGILQGRPFTVPTVTWLSFLAFIFLPLLLFELSIVVAICGGAMFFLSGVLCFHYSDAWTTWAVRKLIADAEAADGDNE